MSPDIAQQTSVITGGVVSAGASKLTVRSKLKVSVFPLASIAVQVTVVVPTGNNELGAGEHGA